MTATVPRNIDSIIPVHILPKSIHSQGGVFSVEWLASASAITCRVRTPASPTNETWVALSSGFPLYEGDITADADEGAVSIATQPTAAALVHGDYLAIATGPVESGGEYTIARVVAITGEGNTVKLGSPLPCDVVAGALNVSMTVRVGVTAAQARDVGMGAIDIKIVDADDVEWVITEPFEIVRRVVAWTVTPDRLQVLMPSIGHLRESDDFTLQETIDAARVNEVLVMLSQKGIREHGIRNAAALEAFFVACVRLHLAKENPSTPSDRLDRLQVDAIVKLEAALQDRDAWYLDDQLAEVPMPPQNESKYLSGIRMTR